jgi:two-component system, chemotaxis family, CheB/CheR fusion protein
MVKRKRSRVTTRKKAAAASTSRTVRRDPPPAASSEPLPMTIVGVGASAGGLEAFSQLLDALPSNAGMAVILVQHLSPDHPSNLAELLASHTRMPVTQVTDGASVERDRVYVIPPNMQMVIEDSTLRLSPRPMDRSQHTPIDTFFESLARLPDARVIAAVLSGTASDGAHGIREVKTAGGITLAQDPSSAKYDSMARAAIATGSVDLVLDPAAMGVEIAKIAAHPYLRQRRLTGDEGAVADDHLRAVFSQLRAISSVDFRHYKQPTIRRRLLRRMALHRLTEIGSYVKLLESDPAEARALFQDLLIHVTRFFREPDSFAALAEHVFPKLLNAHEANRPIRVWVCGCATGEEPYSLAIALVEFLDKVQSRVPVQIFATDVSEVAIERARAGLYPATIAADVGANRLRRFFTKADGHYRVTKPIRDMCVFARQDLTKDPPFSRLDLVMCRNVLIYLNAELQKRLIGLFHYALHPHGYLILGHAETIGAQAGLFATVDKKHRIHRKKSAPREAAGMTFASERHESMVALKSARFEPPTADHGLQVEINRAVLDRYAPSGVVVDAEMQIVQFRGQTGEFLEATPGAATLNLFKMTREGLIYGLRTAVNAARKTRAPARQDGLHIRTGQKSQTVAIEVIPLTGLSRPYYLVLFEESAGKSQAAEPPAKRTAKAGAGKDGAELLVLQQELQASREYMQSIIQELEAANEELQSANEEILSSNEELQSTNEELDTAKEELQSTNEELNTLNEELHGRNEEMSRINSDLINLVASVQIAIVIVSTDLRIRRFTPMAEKILNLIPADLDRAIGQINPNINCPDIEPLIVECMDSVSMVEREVQDRQGRWYSLRIRPYKTIDNKIDGAVLALFDIDILKRSERKAMLARDFAESVLHFTSQPIAVTDPSFEIRQANTAFGALFALSPEDLRGRPLLDLVTGTSMATWNGPHRIGAMLPPLTATPRNGRKEMQLAGRVVPSVDGGDAPMVLVTASELTDRGDSS